MKRSQTADMACLQRLPAILAAVVADAPAWIPAMNEARDNGHRSGWPTGQPGGRGGHADLSDRLRYDPAGNLVANWDPADQALAEFGRHLDAVRTGLVGMRGLMERTRRPGDLTPTGLCRDGHCPAGNMASKGKAGRCSACSAFYYATGIGPDPDAVYPCYEREEVRQTPTPRPLNMGSLGRRAVDEQAVA